eukprot:COSAG02_NODE_6504_length_3534_cov_1.715575_4_plen_172_part_00
MQLATLAATSVESASSTGFVAIAVAEARSAAAGRSGGSLTQPQTPYSFHRGRPDLYSRHQHEGRTGGHFPRGWRFWRRQRDRVSCRTFGRGIGVRNEQFLQRFITLGPEKVCVCVCVCVCKVGGVQPWCLLVCWALESRRKRRRRQEAAGVPVVSCRALLLVAVGRLRLCE